jgi:hypothetical protein
MTGIVEPDDFLFGALVVWVCSTTKEGRQYGSCLPSKKKMGSGKSGPSEFRSILMTSRRKCAKGKHLAAEKTEVIGKRIFRS